MEWREYMEVFNIIWIVFLALGIFMTWFLYKEKESISIGFAIFVTGLCFNCALSAILKLL